MSHRNFAILALLLFLPVVAWPRVQCELYMWKRSKSASRVADKTSLHDLCGLYKPIRANTNLTAGQEIEGFIDAKVGSDGIRGKVVKALQKNGAKDIKDSYIYSGDDTVGYKVEYSVDGDKQKFSIRTDEDLTDLPSGTVSIEITSPVLSTGKEARFFMNGVKAATKLGFTPIATGGVHTHVGIDVNNAKLAAILKAWMKIEEGVLESFSIHDDRRTFIAPLDQDVVDLIINEAVEDPNGLSTKFEKGTQQGYDYFADFNFGYYLQHRYLTDDLQPNFKNEDKPLFLTLNRRMNQEFAAMDKEIWRQLDKKSDSAKFKSFIKDLKKTDHFRMVAFGQSLGIDDEADSDILYDIGRLAKKGRHVALNVGALRKFGTGELRIFNSTTNEDLLEFQREFGQKFFLAVLSQSPSLLKYLDALDRGRAFDITELAQALNIEGGAARMRKILAITAQEAKTQAADLEKYKQDDDDDDGD